MVHARKLTAFCAAVAALAVAGCGDNATATTAALFDDSTATLDIAASAGDAAATMVATMQTDEDAPGITSDIAPSSFGLSTASSAALMSSAAVNNPLVVVRVRTCLDALGVVVAGCSPIASVRTIVNHVTIDGTRSDSASTTGGVSATWTGSVHRVADDTATRVFVGGSETSRIHNNKASAHDTTMFVGPATTRTNAEVAHDTVKAVTFNLPRASNPFPVSGTIVRVDSVHTSIIKANRSETKDIVRTVTITFPADAQGNVVLTVNAKTCNLNLVTHRVTQCH